MKRLILASVAMLALVTPDAAHAIPAGGAGADTPGTSASVSPATLPVGGALHFTVTGFPAGEVVYVKIDDGNTCSASAVHGACVVHQQRLDGRGAASGTIVLPSDVGPGKHWLRFLASQEVTGDGGGVKGYTARGDSDFTVTAKASGGSGGGSDTGGSTPAAPPAQAATDAAAAGGAADTVPVIEAVPTAGAILPLDPPKPAATVTVTAQPAPAAATPVSSAAAEQAPVAKTRPPYVGIGGLILLLGLAGALVARRVKLSRA